MNLGIWNLLLTQIVNELTSNKESTTSYAGGDCITIA